MAMSEDQAFMEAQRRWHAHGAWVQAEWTNPETLAIHRHAVGIRVPSGSFTKRRLLGHGKTWEQAFRMAERTITADLERLKKAKRVDLEAGAPSGELFPRRTTDLQESRP